MSKERVLKILLVLVGLLFIAGIYPVTIIVWQRDEPGYTDAMMGTLYITLGILLLLAARNPSANRSLIAFAGWSSLAHAAVMAIMALRDARAHEHILGVVLFAAIGAPLAALVPARQTV
jgi:hypothetical protein